MSEAIAAVVGQAASKVLGSVIAKYALQAAKAISRESGDISAGFSRYFESTFIKCTMIKTILSEDPSPLMTCHVDQSFKIGEKSVDHYGLVEIIKNGGNVVISGTGGSGKSIFNKYLWVSLLEDSRGTIPIYFELRLLNDAPDRNLIEVIYYNTIDTSASKITIEEMTSAVRSGEIVLLLDGFDEVNNDRRKVVEREVLDIIQKYPDSQIILTGRPDERFAGWPQFTNAKIQPLSKSAVLELIRRADFSENYKTAMLKRLKGGLYETHKSFLTNPLLCYLMLVTVANESKIETNRSLFYEQAYEALFYRHDLRKGGYVRQMHSGLDKNQFRSIFSFFALRTYLTMKGDIAEVEMLDHFTKAKAASGVNATEGLVLQDAIESVCLIKREGLDFSFTHRSLQEYFSAFCVARLMNKNFGKILENFASRGYDQVFALAYEIKPDLVISEYIVPTFAAWELEMGNNSNIKEALLFGSIIGKLNLECEEVSGKKKGVKLRVSSISFSPNYLGAFLGAMARLKRGATNVGMDYFFNEGGLISDSYSSSSPFFKKISSALDRASNFSVAVTAADGIFSFEAFSEGRSVILSSLELTTDFLAGHMGTFLHEEMSSITKFSKDVIKNFEARNQGLEDLVS